MDPKLAAAIAVVPRSDHQSGCWVHKLPPLTRLMGHTDRIDLLVEDGEFPLGVGVGISDRHRPGPVARPA